jgi:uncharacterized protein
VPATESLQPDQARGLAADANDALAEAIRRHPNRFAGFATLPMSDPAAAAAELDRAVNKLGFTGAMINGQVAGIYLDAQQYWTIFEAAQALGVPIYLHPNRPPQAVIDACYSGLPSAVSNTLATGAWGWHIDTGLHVLRLIVSGGFDAFPALNLIIGHMGEALPSMIWRADTMLRKFVSLQRPVHQYFSDNVYVTTSGIFDYPPFAAALHSIGTDRILFSVDYPYSDNLEAISFFERLPLSVSDREKVAHGNADRLLRLPAPTDSVVQATS